MANRKLLKQEMRLHGTEKVAVNFKVEDVKPKERIKSVDIVKVESVYFLPTKVINDHKKPESKTDVKRKELIDKLMKCKLCGDKISENEYRAQNGLCHECWSLCYKWRNEGPEKDPVREARRAGLLGADRAGTW